MILTEAETIVASVIAPVTLDDFFSHVQASRPFDSLDGSGHPRAALFGSDPARTVLAGFATHAAQLDCHATAPSGPRPQSTGVEDAGGFAALIAAYHDRGYTVRVPDVEPLSAPLLMFTRALENLLHQPVSVSLFWSKAGSRAKIHYDNNDIITVQLRGQKRWFVSTDPAGLQNPWRELGEPLPHLDRHRVIDTGPGDLLYVPRGTPHSVTSDTESLHLSILFTPLTLRAAIIAALDQLSDDDLIFRRTLTPRPSHGNPDALAKIVTGGLSRLAQATGDPDFVSYALARRSSRAVGELKRHAPAAQPAELGAKSRIRRSPLAAVHLSNASEDTVDVAVPGGHLAINANAMPALAYIAGSVAFAIDEIPGLPVDVAIALVDRLIAAGLLEPA